MAAMQAHQVVIVCGETGSGKTTQLPKMALALGRGQGKLGSDTDFAKQKSGSDPKFPRKQIIGHTQPRRIAASSVAKRIAEELKTPLGEVVGFKVRFQDRLSKDASVKLMTDGILLAETQNDPLLKAYDTIIIDEAHERSLNIDFLLGYLREILPRRPDLKIIVTSATIDADRFAQHFASAKGPAPVIMVSVTATGEFDGVNPVTRSGARVGHQVAVAGDLGRARHGLDLLFEHAMSPDGVVDEDAVAELWRTHPAELSAQLRPAPPIFAGRIAALAGASSMMDISDGLVLDAARICAASGVGIDFDLASVGSRIALTGGEDHSLLATFPLSATIPPEFRVIGRVVPNSGVSVDGVPFTAKGGWDPLRDG